MDILAKSGYRRMYYCTYILVIAQWIYGNTSLKLLEIFYIAKINSINGKNN